MTFEMMQNYPLSILHASVRPESLPGADLQSGHRPKVAVLRSRDLAFRKIEADVHYCLNL